jgi:hypothetical protein
MLLKSGLFHFLFKLVAGSGFTYLALQFNFSIAQIYNIFSCHHHFLVGFWGDSLVETFRGSTWSLERYDVCSLTAN